MTKKSKKISIFIISILCAFVLLCLVDTWTTYRVYPAKISVTEDKDDIQLEYIYGNSVGLAKNYKLADLGDGVYEVEFYNSILTGDTFPCTININNKDGKIKELRVKDKVIYRKLNFDKVELKVYGKKAEEYKFVLEDKIADIKDIIDKLYIKEKYIADEGDMDLPKGITYQLSFVDEDRDTVICELCNGYLVVNGEVCEVDNYNKVIEEVENIFEVVYE